MKKIFKTALLSLTALPLLTGCGGTPVDIEALAQEAANTVGVAYGSFAATNGITLAGASLITEYTHNGYVFGFEYEVAPFSSSVNYPSQYLQIDGTKLVVEIPTFDELNGGSYAAYILSADITYLGVAEGKEVAPTKVDTVVLEETWNIRINAEKVKPVWQKISEARTKQSGETVVTSGYVCGFMNDIDSGEYYTGVWIADGSDGMMLYSGKLDNYFGVLKIGDPVMVIGTASPYGGLFEIKPTSVVSIDPTATPQPISEPTYKVVTEAQIKAMTTVNTNELVKVENCTLETDVDTLEAKSGTALSLKVKFGNTSWTCYVNKHTNLAQREALIAHLKANKGKSFTLRSIISCNSNVLQFGLVVCGAGEGLVENIVFNA